MPELTRAERRELFARAFKRMNDCRFPRAEYYLLLHLWADAMRRESRERLAIESTTGRKHEANQEKSAA